MSKKTAETNAAQNATTAQPKKKVKGGIYAFAKGRTNDVLLMSPYDLHIEDGFNCRNWESPKNIEHIENLAQLMIANGFDKSKAIHCRYDLATKKIFIKDGECRWRAIIRAIEVHGATNLNQIPVTTDKTEDSLFERLLRPITSNTALKPSQLEICSQIAKIQRITGADSATIAAQINRDAATINRYIKIYNTITPHPEIEKMITSGELTVNMAMSIIEEAEHNSEKALEIIEIGREAQKKEISEQNQQAHPALALEGQNSSGHNENIVHPATTEAEDAEKQKGTPETAASAAPAPAPARLMPRHLQKSGGPVTNLGKALRDLYAEKSSSGLKIQRTNDGSVVWIMSESNSRRLLQAAKINVVEEEETPDEDLSQEMPSYD